MRKLLLTLMLASMPLMSGCAKPDNQAAELASALETRVQSLEAALPDDDRLPDPPANASSAPTS